MKNEAFMLREETPADYSAIHALIETAFKTARVKQGDEQDYVGRLRKAGGYIPELALVAAEGDRLTGHVVFVRQKVDADGGSEANCLLLGCLSVALECRGKGVGAALVREGLRRAAEMDFNAVFVVGDPAYYGRFGFKEIDRFGCRYLGGIPAPFVQAVELKPDALSGGTFDINLA